MAATAATGADAAANTITSLEGYCGWPSCPSAFRATRGQRKQLRSPGGPRFSRRRRGCDERDDDRARALSNYPASGPRGYQPTNQPTDKVKSRPCSKALHYVFISAVDLDQLATDRSHGRSQAAYEAEAAALGPTTTMHIDVSRPTPLANSLSVDCNTHTRSTYELTRDRPTDRPSSTGKRFSSFLGVRAAARAGPPDRCVPAGRTNPHDSRVIFPA